MAPARPAELHGGNVAVPMSTHLLFVARAGAALAALVTWGGCGQLSPGEPVTGNTAAGVAYEAVGSGDPVVLVHGFSLDRRSWEPQVEVLRRTFRVIRYDLRGHGASAPPTAPYSAYDDLRAVLDTLGVPTAVLLGLSAGAQVAVDFALAYPHRVRKLLLASPSLSGYVPRAPFDWFQPIAAAVQRREFDRAAEMWAETALMTIPSDSAAHAAVGSMIRDNALLWSYQNHDRALDPPAIGRLADIAVPTLIIIGERDLPDVHAVADTLVDCIGDARVVTVPGVGHLVNLAAPGLFNEAMMAFLEEGAPRKAGAIRSPCATRWGRHLPPESLARAG